MKRWIVPILALVILCGLIVWRLQTKRAEAEAQVRQRQMRAKAPLSVMTAPAVVRDIISKFENVGSVESPFNVRFAAQVTGRITAITVREGDHVTKDELLVQIDPAQALADVRQAQSAAAAAQYQYVQARYNLDPTDVNIAAQLRTQQAARVSADANLEQTKANAKSSVAAAEQSVADAEAKVSAAQQGVIGAQASLGNAQANLQDASLKYTRNDNLYKERYIAAQDLDDARAARDVAQGNVNVAKSQLSGAHAALKSAQAQERVAEHNLDIARQTGTANVQASQALNTQAKDALTVAEANRAQRKAYRQQLAALKANAAAAESALHAAQAQLSYTTIRSPIDGWVTERNMDPGATPTPGQVILAAQSLKVLWVSVPVPEEVVRKLHLGMQASASFDALPGRVFVGRVTQINPAADPLTRQFAVRITLPNPQEVLKPGMFGRVDFETERLVGAVVVPREAVQHDSTGAFVTVVDPQGRTERRSVETGPSDSEGTAILSGLSAGDRVVILSASPLKPGAKIRMPSTSSAAGRHKAGGASPR